jgi:hypothetical protein
MSYAAGRRLDHSSGGKNLRVLKRSIFTMFCACVEFYLAGENFVSPAQAPRAGKSLQQNNFME